MGLLSVVRLGGGPSIRMGPLFVGGAFVGGLLDGAWRLLGALKRGGGGTALRLGSVGASIG